MYIRSSLPLLKHALRKTLLTAVSDRVPETHLSMVVQQPISRKGACLVLIERKECSIWVHSTAISRSTIDRERWQIQNNQISEKQNIKKKGYDQATGRTRVNIGAAFQRWREQKEWEGLESDAGVVLFLFDGWVTLILLCFTQLIRVGFSLNMLSCHLCLCPRLSLPSFCLYVWIWRFCFISLSLSNKPPQPPWLTSWSSPVKKSHLRPWSRWRYCLLSCDLPPFILNYTPPNSQHGVC